MAGRSGSVRSPSAKVLPPAAPALLLARPQLEERLAEALQRRLTTVVAEAGFGKSSLLSSWVGSVHSAWYSATQDDSSLDALARGLVDALRLRVPGLPADLRTVLAGSRGPDAGSDELERAKSWAALICQALQEQLNRDLVLVVDEFHELTGGAGALRLVDSICREAPPTLHVVLASRVEPPFPMDRLRGQGQVLELGGSDLAFSAAETLQVLAELAGQEDAETAEKVHRATGGWPAAVRLAAESLREVPASGRAAALDRIRRPGGPLFAYLAAEVFAHEPPEVRQLVSTVAPLERFTAELCEALGVKGADEILRSLARRGLFVELYGDAAGWYSLGAPVRDFALGHLALGAAGRRRVHRRAARWLEEHGHLEEALRSLGSIGDHARIERVLLRHGTNLLARGAVESVTAAIGLLPPERRGQPIEELLGEALQVQGDWDGALRSFEKAASGAEQLSPGLAWRMALIHQLRGRLAEAFEVYGRAEIGDGSRETALLLAWRASAYWLRGDALESRKDARRAFELASAAADPHALAAAYTALAMLAALEGDRGANDAHYLRALDYAEQAGDVLQLIRIRANRGSRHLEEGAYEEAITELDLALRLADLAGYGSFRALALTNRGEARRRLGRFEEAVVDLEQARDLYQRLGSRMISYPLRNLGEVYWERGDSALARAAFEEAIAQADAAGDLQGLGPALAGLARLLATDEPEQAAQLAERARSLGYGMAEVQALLADGWVALARGDRDRAARRGAEAGAAARGRRDLAGLAESLELRALAAPEPAAELRWLEEAAGLWRELRSRVREIQVERVLALIEGDVERARSADERLTFLGARAHRARLSDFLPPAVEPPLLVQTLGRFRVLRDGAPISLVAWQSRKARDLLKILVARRGRPTPRDYLMEALWPGQAPERLGSRLSVLLSTVRSVLDPEKRFDPDHFVAADAAAVWLQTENVPIDVERFLALAADGLAQARVGAFTAGQQLAEAEAAFSGDFLEEDAYEDWAIAFREEVRATYVEVARALAEDAARRGEADAAARFYRRVLERDAYDEPAHLALVGVLSSAGRHGEARRCFHAYCARMDEIGVESVPFPDRAT